MNDIWLCNVDCHKKKRTRTIRNETLIYFNILLMIYLQRREKTYLSGEIVASAHGVDEASSSVFGCVKLLQQGAGAPLRNLVFNNNQSVWKQNNSLESSSPKYRQRSRRTQLPSVSGSHNLLFYHNYNISNITTCCACSLFLFWAKIGCFFFRIIWTSFFREKFSDRRKREHRWLFGFSWTVGGFQKNFRPLCIFLKD